MSESGKRLLAAAKEANKIAKGQSQPASLYVPADVDVKKIRRSMSLSQENFAAEFGFSLTQVRDWEQGRSRPLDASRAYLMMIDVAPEAVRNLLSKVKEKAFSEQAA